MQLEVYTAVAALEHSQFFPMLPAGLTLAATQKNKTKKKKSFLALLALPHPPLLISLAVLLPEVHLMPEC